ncbi:MAG: manganese efflux pump MntP family protein [Firmicutes bacterium]|nr:manganese efflux pump MntP family protein [Bacillota bacterium]
MAILDILLYAVVLSIDATAVAITNGVCYRGFTHKKLAKAAALFGLFQGIMPLIGYYLYYLFAESSLWFVTSGKWIAFGLLLFVGGKMIYEGIKAIVKPESCLIKDNLSGKELLVQAVATSVDALAVGVSIYIANDGTNIWIAAGVIAVVTLILSFVGGVFGKKIGPFVEKVAPILGGLVLVFIGLKILLGF